MRFRVELNHYSHRKGAEGVPGETVEVDKATADLIEKSGGGTVVGEVKEKVGRKARRRKKKNQQTPAGQTVAKGGLGDELELPRGLS